MLRNVITEDYLKGYSPKLSSLLWTGEEDYSEQKVKATDYVFNALIQRTYKPKELMPELVLRDLGTSLSSGTETTEGKEDTINRMRIVFDNITNTLSAKAVTIQGSNDNETFYNIQTVNLDITTGVNSVTSKTVMFYDSYKYYRLSTVVLSGAIDYRAYIVESIYDELFACMWMVFILNDAKTSDEDEYGLQMHFYKNMFDGIMNSVKLYLDANADGIPDGEVSTTNLYLTR